MSTRTAALLSVAGFWVARQNLAMRPQLIGVLLFSVTLWILAGRRTHPRALWAIPVLMLIWVNVHGSFVLAPLLLGLAWLEDRKDSPGDGSHAPRRRALRHSSPTLANPFGLARLGIRRRDRHQPHDQPRVTEWAPPTIHDYSGVVFFGSALIIVGYLVRRKETVAWPHLFWLAKFFVLALPALRGVVWWGLAFPVVVAGLVMREGRCADEERGSPFMNTLLVTTIVADGDRRDAGLARTPRRERPRSSVRPHRLWCDATVAAVPPGSRLFVSQTYASWFEFALPSMPVFVDSRIELFPTAIWDDVLRRSVPRERGGSRSSTGWTWTRS